MMMKSVEDILPRCPQTNEEKIYRQPSYSW